MSQFRLVTQDEFYAVIGPQDVCPRPIAPYPYRSDFVTPHGTVRGYQDRDGKYYLLVGASA